MLTLIMTTEIKSISMNWDKKYFEADFIDLSSHYCD